MSHGFLRKSPTKARNSNVHGAVVVVDAQAQRHPDCSGMGSLQPEKSPASLYAPTTTRSKGTASMSQVSTRCQASAPSPAWSASAGLGIPGNRNRATKNACDGFGAMATCQRRCLHSPTGSRNSTKTFSTSTGSTGAASRSSTVIRMACPYQTSNNSPSALTRCNTAGPTGRGCLGTKAHRSLGTRSTTSSRTVVPSSTLTQAQLGGSLVKSLGVSVAT